VSRTQVTLVVRSCATVSRTQVTLAVRSCATWVMFEDSSRRCRPEPLRLATTVSTVALPITRGSWLAVTVAPPVGATTGGCDRGRTLRVQLTPSQSHLSRESGVEQCDGESGRAA